MDEPEREGNAGGIRTLAVHNDTSIEVKPFQAAGCTSAGRLSGELQLERFALGWPAETQQPTAWYLLSMSFFITGRMYALQQTATAMPFQQIQKLCDAYASLKIDPKPP